MFDNQLVGKLDNQKEIKTETQPPETESNQEMKPNFQEGKKTINPKGSYPENQMSHKDDFNRASASYSNSNQQMQKIPTYKMTFTLTEDIYKAFNDLYANRILLGRKTEKSDMIREAIQWLIKMEEKQSESS